MSGDPQSTRMSKSEKDIDDKGLYRHSDMPPDHPAGHKPLREAAVLIALIRKVDDWDVLFIRRAERDGDRHSGQVAFPGGARETSDRNLQATAVRETLEETGIDPANITVLDELRPYQTISNFRVTPFVALLRWPVPLKPQPDEVSRIFTIPLSWLSNHDNLELRARTEQDRRDTGRTHPVVYYDRYDDELLWGATARMTLNLTKALIDGQIVLPTDG